MNKIYFFPLPSSLPFCLSILISPPSYFPCHKPFPIIFHLLYFLTFDLPFCYSLTPHSIAPLSHSSSFPYFSHPTSSILLSFTPPPPSPLDSFFPFLLPQNHERETALHCAAQYGHSEVVSVLLQELTDPTTRNSQQETPLDLAALYGRLQVSGSYACTRI